MPCHQPETREPYRGMYLVDRYLNGSRLLLENDVIALLGLINNNCSLNNPLLERFNRSLSSISKLLS